MKSSIILHVFWLFSLVAHAASGITFHGRIIKSSDDTPLLSPTAEFRIRIQSPGSESCLMWEETQTRDMSASNGVFTLTVGQATAPNTTAILNSATAANFTLPQVFSNGINYTGLTCSIGTSYNALSLHGRVMQVSFRETAGVGVWEDLPETSVNYVPLAYRAVDSETLGGRSANEFLKIASYPSQTILSNPQVDSLLGLVNGSSTTYLRPADNFAGDVTGPSTATVVSRIRGTNVVATAPTLNQVLKFDGTNWVPSADDAGAAPGDASYAAKGVVQINTDQTTSGLFIASGVLALPNVITAAGPIGGVSTIPVVTYDQKGRLTAVTTATVDDTTKLPLAGGTMTGSINMGTQNITNATSIAAANFSGRNLVLNDNDTNTVTIRTPADITANYALTLPVDDGTVGQVLTTDGAGILSWSAASAGAVTSVSSTNAYLSVATATTTPALTLNVGTAANTVAAGDDSRIVNAVQAAAYSADLAPAALCTTAQTPYWNTVSDLWACQNISVNADALGLFANGGNTFAGAATLGTNDNFALSFETNNTARMTILNNGNVGIGDTNPNAPLRIVQSTANTSGAIEAGIDLYRTFTAADSGSKIGVNILVQAGNATGNFPQVHGIYSQITKGNAGTIAYGENYTAATFLGAGSINYLSGLRVTNAGGAGTVSNQYGVYIDNLTKGSTNYAIYAAGSTNSYFGGNIGIDALTPGAKLQIGTAGTSLGTMRLTGNTSGYVQIQPAAAAGSWTMTLPANDGDPSQVLTTDGSGVLSWAAASGGATTLDGLTDVVTDYTTTYNMYLGSGVGSTTTTGLNNTALGSLSLPSITSASNIVAIGSESLFSLTTGNSNTAVGRESMYGTTTGSQNTAVGMYSLAANTTGGSNVAIGDAALSGGNANSNTAVGSAALGGAITGNDNVALGYRAGVKATGASYGNIFLGNMAGPDTNSTVTDSLWIHNYEGVPTIYGDLFNKRVGIATTTPGAMFQLGTAGTSLGTMRMTGNTSGYVQIQPAAAAGSWNMTLPANDGDPGQVLSTDGSGVTSWVSATSGTVTEVTSANAYLSVATGTTTPALTLNVGNGANTVAAGDDSRITGAVQSTTYNADLAPAALCTTIQTPYWNTVSDLWACQNINFASGGAFVNLGNSFTADATLGTNDVYDLNFETSGSTRMTILDTGNVGIGTTGPASLLTVNGTTNTNLLTINGVVGSNSLHITQSSDDATGGGIRVKKAGAGTGTGVIFMDTSNFIIGRGSNSNLTLDNFGGTTLQTNLTANGFAKFGAGPTTITTLNGAINSSVTTVTVASTTGYPTTGTLYIDQEAISYTSLTGTTFTGITRGVWGTTAAAHSNGDQVNLYLAAGSSSATAAPKFSMFADGSFAAGNGHIEGGYGTAKVALGGSSAAGDLSTAIGHANYAAGEFSMALGFSSFTYGTNSKTFATNSAAFGNESIAIGNDVETGVAFGGNGFGDYSMAIGLGEAAGVRPAVTGTSSLGIFMGDQSGVVVSASNVMSVMGGSVGIGRVDPAYPLDVIGDIRTSQCLRYNASTLGACSSDERIKKDIHSFDLGLKELLGIQPKYFKYNGLGGEPVSEQEQMGVIAQEVEKVAPQLIATKSVKLYPGDKEKTEIKTVNYGAFTYMLMNAVKELYSLIDSKADKTEVEHLRAENAQLKAYLCAKDPSAPICK